VKNLDSKRRHRRTSYADAEVKIVTGNGLRAFEQFVVTLQAREDLFIRWHE